MNYFVPLFATSAALSTSLLAYEVGPDYNRTIEIAENHLESDVICRQVMVALNSGAPLEIISTTDGVTLIVGPGAKAGQELSVIAFLADLTTRNFAYSELVQRAGAYLERQLNTMRVSPKAADVIRLQRGVVAAQLHLSLELLDQFPEFEKFVTANKLHNDIPAFGHEVTVDEQGVPYLLYRGERTAWTKLKDLVPYNAYGHLTDHLYTRDFGLVEAY